MASTNRKIDSNGWVEIRDNPLSKVGIFTYRGQSMKDKFLDGTPIDPNKVYRVLRPKESLNDPETIASLKLIPWVDDHPPTALGPGDDGLIPAEKKGIHGVVGEDGYFDDSDQMLKSNIKVFSNAMDNLINNDKVELSMGYRCDYINESGIIDGENYDAVQTNIRFNHLALVDEGRMGHDVMVMDSAEKFLITIDSKELQMADAATAPEDGAKDGGTPMTMESALAFLKQMAPMLTEAVAIVKGIGAEPEAADPTMTPDDDMSMDDAKEKDVAVTSDAAFKALQSDMAEMKKNGLKAVLHDVAKRDSLVRQASPIIGTFDAADKTSDEVAVYVADKLGLKCAPGTEQIKLEGYFAARQPVALVTMDSKPKANWLDAQINGSVK